MPHLSARNWRRSAVRAQSAAIISPEQGFNNCAAFAAKFSGDEKSEAQTLLFHLLGWEVQELIGQPAHQVMHHTRVSRVPYPVEDCPIYA